MTLLLVLVGLVLVIGTSYAWLTIALNPEVQRIETNVGANGSLEIALLTEETFRDPALIRTTVGDSAVKQDVKESNISWGNVIQLGGGYGLEEITLLPARLNVETDQDGAFRVGSNVLKTAAFGVDGRIRILDEDTVSAVWETSTSRPDFTYYVAQQKYGVRAIGTISNLSAQQIALAQARALVPAYTSAATRTAQEAWETYGPMLIEMMNHHYVNGWNKFSTRHIEAVRGFAMKMLEASEYTLDAMYQLTIGLVASYLEDEPEFEALRDQILDPANYGKVSSFIKYAEGSKPYLRELSEALQEAEEMMKYAQSAALGSVSLSIAREWSYIEQEVVRWLVRPMQTYMNGELLADREAYKEAYEYEILLPTDSGVYGQMAALVGNFDAHAVWEFEGQDRNLEAKTVYDGEGYLIQVLPVLESVKAATGGWTRANMDDLYGFAIDMAFRSNVPSKLQLQTAAAMRVEDTSEFPVTQGGGSFMEFWSDNMDAEHLVTLMDTIRVGFLNDRGELMGVAKLDLSNSYEYEGTINAPLRLYEFALNENGQIDMLSRSDDPAIMDLHQNSPAIVTVVVWLDGDQVDNSMVSELGHQSMSGILNLQFSSSADLIPSNQLMDRN